MLAEIVPTEVTTLDRQLPAFNIIMIIILYIEQGEGDIARKSMGIYTYVRSLQEVFTKLEKCRKPVNDKKIMMTTSQHPTWFESQCWL